MSKVVIAYCNETWWLVEGGSHLYDMLKAEEGPDLEIAIVSCRTFPEVVKMWKEPEEGAMPWAIHPKIIERLKTRERTTVT